MIKSKKLHRVGTCDLCGEVSSHLFEGACPGCNDRYHPLFAHDDQGNGEPPIGYEAADIQVVRRSA